MLASALAEDFSVSSTCVCTPKGTFGAVFDEESGNTYYLLGTTWGLAFYRYHPQNGWEKLANVFNGVREIEYSDGWVFYKKEGGWSGGYSDLLALNVETCETVHLVKNTCDLLAAVDGEAIIFNRSSKEYERVNPETMMRTQVNWVSGCCSQTGVSFKDEADAWSFKPYGGETVQLGFVSEHYVYTLRPDCWVVSETAVGQEPCRRLEIWRGGVKSLTVSCDEWLMDDRYVVWYVVEQERWKTNIGGITVYQSSDEHIKHLYIYDTMGDSAELRYVKVPVDFRIDRGMCLINNTAMILADERWGHSTIVCVDLASGEMTTLQN